MKNLKKVLGGAIAFMVLCSVTSFSGVKAEAKDVRKCLRDDSMLISRAYMYGDKAIVFNGDRTLYYDKKVQKDLVKDYFFPEGGAGKYVFLGNNNEQLLFNIEDGTQKDASSIFEKMGKAVKEKYNLKDDEFFRKRTCVSDTDVFWATFMITKDNKNKYVEVSSNGDIIEVPNDYYALSSMHNDKIYGLKEDKNKVDIDVYSKDNEKVNLCTIDKEDEEETLTDLTFNSKDEMYILSKTKKDSMEKEICKVTLEGNKGKLTIVAKCSGKNSSITLDNNKNIWYLDDGLIYKIENDKPVLKYEVQKSRNMLFVSDDNNLIVSGNESEEDPVNNGRSTIINISDKYINGWGKEDYGWSYYEDREAVTSEWRNIDGKWYYFGSQSQMVQGWMQEENGNVYCLSDEGDALVGWHMLGESHSWYYFDNNAVMATGWKQVDGAWYYLDGNGIMVTGWKQVDGTWYYLNDNGSMATGWKQVGGTWYYLNDNGSMAKGWKQIGGAWYYMYSNGTMAHDTTIDGYKIGSNGAML